jgi:hypothetical protein
MKRVLSVHLLAAFFSFAMLCAASAQSAPAKQQTKPPVKPAPPVTTTAQLPTPPEDASETKSAMSYYPTSGVSFTVGGGYFIPQSSAANMFKPSWAVRLTARNNNIADTLFGIGCDLSYSTLSDKVVKGGRMTYFTVLPHVTAAFSFFDWFDIVGKAGPGITALVSKVNGTSGGSAALTLGFGGGIARVFGERFIMGIESDYYYYMQRNPSSTIGAYLYMGYRM